MVGLGNYYSMPKYLPPWKMSMLDALPQKGGLLYGGMVGGGGLMQGGGWWDTLVNWGKNLWNTGKKIYDVAKPIINDIKDSGIIDKGIEIGKDLFNKGKDVITNIKDGNTSGTASAIRDLFNTGKAGLTNISTIAKPLISTHQDSIRNLLNTTNLAKSAEAFRLQKSIDDSQTQKQMNRLGDKIAANDATLGNIQGRDINAAAVIQSTVPQSASGLIRKTMHRQNKKFVKKMLRGRGLKRM